MDALAQRIAPKATWDDMVLPAADMALLRQLAAQVQHRHTVYEEWGFAAKRAAREPEVDLARRWIFTAISKCMTSSRTPSFSYSAMAASSP